jgi:hypothetical protein
MTAQEIAVARERLQKRHSSLQQTFRLLHDRRVHQALYSIPLVRRSARIGKYVARAVLPAPTRCLLRQWLLHPKLDDTPNNHVQSDYLPSQGELDIYTTDVVFSIDKARRVLGYVPKIDCAEGMERTTAWIKWARL